MKLKLYIETSVVSYLVGRASTNTVIAGHQAATQELWVILKHKFIPHIPDLVLQEAADGAPELAALRIEALKDIPVLDVDRDVEMLAQLLIDRKAVPRKCPEDAVHIAVASVNKIDLIATWNFKHINNPAMKQRMREVLADANYILPEICSPDELLEVDDE